MSNTNDTAGQAIAAAARTLYEHGMSVLPILPGVSKRPAVRWTEYQDARPRPDELDRWFAPGHEHGVGIVTGPISGNLEMTEIEGRAVEAYPVIRSRMLAEHPELWEKLQQWVELSPSGGIHWYYQLTTPPPGNTKIAQRPADDDELAAQLVIERGRAQAIVDPEIKARRLAKLDRATGADFPQTLAETRGTGGFVVVAPTDGTHHATGRPWSALAGGVESIVVLTEQERATFHALLHELLDTMPARPAPAPQGADQGAGSMFGRPGVADSSTGRTPGRGLFREVSPLDDFEARTTWEQILEPHGWTRTPREDPDGTRYWLRPGSAAGAGHNDHSATTGHSGDRDRLYVFSTSTEFDTEVPYTKAGALAVLEYGGDHSAMARDLKAKGYGSTGAPLPPAPPSPLDPPAPAPQPVEQPARDEDGLPIVRDGKYTAAETEGDEWAPLPDTPTEQDREEIERAYIAHRAAEQRLNILAADEARRLIAAEHGIDGSTWQPVDLTDVLDGEWLPPEPELMRRTDGRCLLYRGMVHTFQGESESGKSMLAQAVAAEVLGDGGRVLYLDFESDRGTVAPRILALGAARDDVAERFHYLNPDEDPTSPLSAAHAAWRGILGTEYDLVVIDGVNEALSVFGKSIIDNDDVTAWGRTFPRTLARETGAAVVCIDHVTKSKDGRGRFAIGAQAKLSYLTGASYTIEPEEYLAPGKLGILTIRVGKDRPGGVRAHAGEYNADDRTQLVGTVSIDSRGDGIVYRCSAAPKAAPAPKADTEFRPTVLMEKVSREYERAADEGSKLTARMCDELVPGDKTYVAQARAVLAAEGYIEKSGKGNSPYVHVRPYREVDDPSTNKYQERASI